MYFKLKNQKKIIDTVIKKAGSERKLAKILNVVKYAIYYYKYRGRIGRYKFKTRRGEFVRNTLEKKIADKLFQFGINYQYEPCIKVNKKYYFPDFKSDNFIIECTMWRGFDKATKLKKKIKNLQKEGYKIFVITPNSLRKFYKSIEEYLIDEKKLLSILSPREPS